MSKLEKFLFYSMYISCICIGFGVGLGLGVHPGFWGFAAFGIALGIVTYIIGSEPQTVGS